MTFRHVPPVTDELPYSGELGRKALHLFALVIPVGYHFVSRPVAVGIVFVCFAASLLIDIARLRHWPIQRLWRRLVNPIVRPRESQGFTGATHILLSGWLCPLLFNRPAAAGAMMVIILGDIAAALVGRRWGSHRYRSNRSLEGSAAFLAGAFVAIMVTPDIDFPTGVVAAVIATVVEAFSWRMDDNLSVPLFTGLFLHLVNSMGMP